MRGLERERFAFAWRVVRPLARLAASRDCVPAAASLSFASPKESKQRKGDPTAAPLEIRGVPCGARELGRLRKLALEYKDSNSAQPSPSTAHPPVHCAPQRRTRGSHRTSLRIGREGSPLRALQRLQAWMAWMVCEVCTQTSPRGDAQRAEWYPPYGALRSAASWGWSGIPATFPHCLRSCTQGRVCGKAPQLVSTARNPAGAFHPARPFFAYFLSAKRKKVSAPPGAYPGLLSSKPPGRNPGLLRSAPAIEKPRKARATATPLPGPPSCC